MKKIYYCILLVIGIVISSSNIFAQGAIGIDIYNGITNQKVAELTNNYQMTLTQALDYNFSGVYTSGIRGQFRLRLNGEEKVVRSEGAAPFAIFRDTDGVYNPWSAYSPYQPEVGDYELDFYIVAANGDTVPSEGVVITRNFTITEATGLEDNLSAKLNVFFSEGMLNISLPQNKISDIQIVSINGKTVYKTSVTGSSRLDANLTRGIYILRVKQDKEVASKKFIVK